MQMGIRAYTFMILRGVQAESVKCWGSLGGSSKALKVWGCIEMATGTRHCLFQGVYSEDHKEYQGKDYDGKCQLMQR